jgi:hypothetical protein
MPSSGRPPCRARRETCQRRLLLAALGGACAAPTLPPSRREKMRICAAFSPAGQASKSPGLERRGPERGPSRTRSTRAFASRRAKTAGYLPHTARSPGRESSRRKWKWRPRREPSRYPYRPNIARLSVEHGARPITVPVTVARDGRIQSRSGRAGDRRPGTAGRGMPAGPLRGRAGTAPPARAAVRRPRPPRPAQAPAIRLAPASHRDEGSDRALSSVRYTQLPPIRTRTCMAPDWSTLAPGWVGIADSVVALGVAGWCAFMARGNAVSRLTVTSLPATTVARRADCAARG